MKIITVHYGDTITTDKLGIIPTKEGYDFAGWDPILPFVMREGNASIVATFTVKTYKIESFTMSVFGYCPETEDIIRYTASGSGRPVAYRIIYDRVAVSAGFENTEFTTIEKEGEIAIEIPYCDANTYNAKLQFRDANNLESELYDITFKVNLSNKYVLDIFEDVVSAVNTENRFLEYQWYHNDEKLIGAVGPYYCERDGLTGNYYMEVLTTDNRQLRTCRKWFAATKDNITLIAYPNPTSDNATFELSFDNGEEHTIDVINALGVKVFSDTFKGQKTTIDFTTLGNGTYVVEVDGLTVKEIKK